MRDTVFIIILILIFIGCIVSMVYGICKNKSDCVTMGLFGIIGFGILIAFLFTLANEENKPYCIECKTEISEDYNFCPNCGEELLGGGQYAGCHDEL